jgi:hypothetical protein
VAHSLFAAIIKAKLNGIAVVDHVVDSFFGDLSPTKPLFQIPATNQWQDIKRGKCELRTQVQQ